ncbi:MAG: ROK family protein [Pseudothermotoga sp.]
MSKIRNSSFLRRNNLRVILREILKHQPVSKSQVAKKLNVNSSTISQLLKPLVDRNIILESSQGPSSGGRPPQLLTINPSAAFSVAVDLSGYSVRIALIDSILRITELQEFNFNHNIYEGLEQIVQKTKQILSTVNGNRILGVCIAVSGVLDPQTGRISSSLIEGLENVRIVEFLHKRLNLPILVENDANLSALGEFMNLEEEIKNMFYIHLGDGLGGGMILDKSIFKGDRGYAGEIGRMIYNCEPFVTVGDVYSQILHEYSVKGEIPANRLVNLLFSVVQNVLSVIDICHFVVGGRYAVFDEKYLLEVEKLARERFYGFEVFIRKSVNNPDAILTGAAEYLTENSIFNI